VIARDLARSIAQSSLVKAAMFGADPNWGRILATVGARGGSQGFAIEPARAEVRIQNVCVFAGGEPQPIDSAALRAKMRAPEVAIAVTLAGGPGAATAWGCDLSYDYVKINADYTSMIVQTADGTLAKDDRLTNYSPSFKRTLLVEALSYIAKFAGTRCVVNYGGTAMHKAPLVKSFCDDVDLLRSVGLQPIVVHGGGPDAPGLDAINAELVTNLNADGSHAMGLSGSDGGLLRGRAGEIVSVNAAVLEMMLGQGFVPVISPIGLGDDGRPFAIDADSAAAAIAVALRVPKLIYVTDVAGLLEAGELVTDLPASDLERRLATGAITGGMIVKSRSILAALRGGVGRAHIIDGRTPHSLIAELFTDRGVGTLVTP
jgi:acetylglutamate kinase